MAPRTFVIIVALALVIGCSKTTTGPSTPTADGASAPTGDAAVAGPQPKERVSLLNWSPQRAVKLRLWHTYRDKEREALGLAVDAFNAANPKIELVSNYTPYDGFENKLRITITVGDQGPDLFIDAHDKLGSWVKNKMVAPLNTVIDSAMLSGLDDFAGKAMVYDGNLYGLPLALKPLAIYFNKAFVPSVPETMESFIGQLNRLQKRERTRRAATGESFYGLAYEAGNLFYHGQWLHAFGGTVLDKDLRPQLDSKAQAQALAFARSLHKRHEFVPLGIDGSMLTSYFNKNQAAAVISGPWLRASISKTIDYGVAMIPTLTGRKAKPFVTVEGVFVSKASRNFVASAKAALFLCQGESAKIRMNTGLQVVAHRPTLEESTDPIHKVFAEQARNAVVLDSRPEMSAIWKPVNEALTKGVFHDDAHIPSLLMNAQKKVVLELRKHTTP